MNDVESHEDGAAITNTDQYNFHIQSSVFETPPSILASPQFTSNLFNSPLLRNRLSCLLCRRESPILRSTHLPGCKHKYCEACVGSVSEHGCPSCVDELNRAQLSQLRLSPTQISSDSLTDSAKTLPPSLNFSIWSSNPTVWDSNKSITFDSSHSLECGSDPVGLFSPPSASSPVSPSTACGSCGDDSRASHFCSDCQDPLCGACVDAHLRVRLTREHKVVPLAVAPRPVPPQTPSGHSSENDSSLLISPPSPSSLCPLHETKLVAVCDWCKSSPLCSACLVEHNGHRVLPLGDIRSAMAVIVADGRQEEKRVDENIEGIRRMGERVDASVLSVASDVRSVICMHISALEERKRELLSLVEMIRVSKMNTLKTQSEVLAVHKTRLQQMSQALDCVKEEEDPAKLATAFENIVKLYSTSRPPRQTNESDTIKFIHPDPKLLGQMRNLGGLESGACARNCHIIGEGFRRAIRDRQANVTVQLRDACNQLCRSKGQQMAAVVLTPGGSPLDVGISERENGQFVLSYVPLQDGIHTLNITVRGTPINGCPANIDVRRGRNYEDIVAQGELFSFGREGSGDGELCRPWGICCDLLGRILVADRSNNRVQIFDKDGHFVSKFGSPGTRAGQFDRPAGITTNTLNQIIVADKDNHRIQVFDQEGNFVLKFGERGRPVGMFNYPWGVATNCHNNIAVSDTRNHRVQIFTSMGQFIRKCGFDSAFFYKHLDSPRGLCYLADGQLLITDFNNHRLAVLSAARSCPDMKCYGNEGDAEGLFCRPQGVKTDPEGHILVCDSRNNRVQVFCGDDFRYVASFGGTTKTNGFQMPQELPAPLTVGGTGPTPPSLFAAAPPKALLDRPTDLCVSPEGRIYVVDFGNNCIRVF